jgi:pentatricopeptide repeat protein
VKIELTPGSPKLNWYNREIAKAVTTNDFTGMMSAVHRMKADGITPNVVTYESILEMFARHGLLQEAWALFSDMEALDIVPRIQTYNLLLAVSVRLREVSHSLKVFSF